MTNTTVNNGQTVNNVDVTSGNFLDVSAGGTANTTTIENGGFVAVEATSTGLIGSIFGPKNGGVANGVTVKSGGILDLRGSNSSASNVSLHGGTLEIDNLATVTGSLNFGPTTGSQASNLFLADSDGNFKPLITGFSSSSEIDIATNTTDNTLTTTMSNGNTVATVSGGGISDTFTFAGTVHLTLPTVTSGEPEAILTSTDSNASAAADVARAPAQSDTVSALQAGHAASQPAMSFLAQPRGAATHGQAASTAAVGTQSLSSMTHGMALTQNHALAGAMLGTLSQAHIHPVEGTVGGFLPDSAAATAGSTGALLGLSQHVATGGVVPALLHIG